MSAFLYGTALQCKLDIRSKTLLITCYVVPLLFFALMGGIFTALNPEAKNTLIQAMTVMGVSMGALIGLPPSLVDVYASDIKKAYQANGVPLPFGLATLFLSAFFHLFVMSMILFAVAPLAFDAALPSNLPLYFVSLLLFIAVSLSVGSVLGLALKNQSRLTMVSQLIFLPSIMLSGIMFPASLLPKGLEMAGKLFPAAWGYTMMTAESFHFSAMAPLLGILLAAMVFCVFLLRRQKAALNGARGPYFCG